MDAFKLKEEEGKRSVYLKDLVDSKLELMFCWFEDGE
jgi:hypothetical protein